MTDIVTNSYESARGRVELLGGLGHDAKRPQAWTQYGYPQAALARWLQDGREPRYLFWWSPFVDQAAQLGAAQSAANLAQLSSVYATARSLDQVVRSEPYHVRVGLARIKSYEHWTWLKCEAQGKLAGIIGQAVATASTRAPRRS